MRRAEIVVLSEERLAELLRLPRDDRVVDVRKVFGRDTFEFVVEGPTHGLVGEGFEPSRRPIEKGTPHAEAD